MMHYLKHVLFFEKFLIFNSLGNIKSRQYIDFLSFEKIS